MRMQESYIDQSKSVLDRRFKEVMDASYQLKETPAVRSFMSVTKEGLEENYFPAIQLHNDLRRYFFVNEIMLDYAIVYKDSDIVADSIEVTPFDVYTDTVIELTDAQKLVVQNELFKEYYYNKLYPVQRVNLHSSNSDVIPMVTSVGYEVAKPRAVIVVAMDGSKLRDSMIGFSENLQGNFYIADDDGNVLISLNDEYGLTEEGTIDPSIFEAKFVTVSVKSDVIPYNYILVEPSEAVFKQMRLLQRSTNLIIFGIFFFGLILSALFARYNSKPVMNLVNDNEELEERIDNQVPYLRTMFLERWLKGNYSSFDEVASITKFLRTDYNGAYYCVLVIDYDEYIDVFGEMYEDKVTDLEIKRLLVKDILTENQMQAEFVHDIDHDKLAVILMDDSENEEKFREYIKEHVMTYKEALDAAELKNVRYGVGSIYEDMSMVSVSLGNALDALSTTNPKENKIIWYDQLEENLNGYYYPFEVENRLFNCVRSGDVEEVNTILRDVLSKNVIERTLVPSTLKVFTYEIYGTLGKIQERAVGEDVKVNEMICEAFDIIDDKTELEKIQYFQWLTVEITKLFADKKQSHHDHIMEKINEYILQNFKDSNFGLPIVAEEFNISYAYLSLIFKEYNGESFINYLQHLRMKEAERLLTETNLAVNEIVMACGYNSSNTFGKAFKRSHGVSASVFRSKQRE